MHVADADAVKAMRDTAARLAEKARRLSGVHAARRPWNDSSFVEVKLPRIPNAELGPFTASNAQQSEHPAGMDAADQLIQHKAEPNAAEENQAAAKAAMSNDPFDGRESEEETESEAGFETMAEEKAEIKVPVEPVKSVEKVPV
eukprot:scaffold188143_cov42-Prasinocladus_malaysianus.AAC.2